MAKGAFHHGFRTRLAELLEQIAFQRTCIHPNPHRAAMILGRLHDLFHALFRTDIARVDAQARRARLGRFNGPFVVEVNVGHDGHARGVHDRPQRSRRFLIGARDPHDVGAGVLEALDLFNGRARIGGQRVGHRLHGDRRIPADCHGADMDLPRFSPHDVAVRPNAHPCP